MSEFLFGCVIVYLVLFYYTYLNKMKQMPLIKPIQVWWRERVEFEKKIDSKLDFCYLDCVNYISNYLRALNAYRESQGSEVITFCYNPFNKSLIIVDPAPLDLTTGFVNFVMYFKKKYERKKITTDEYNRYVSLKFLLDQYFIELKGKIKQVKN